MLEFPGPVRIVSDLHLAHPSSRIDMVESLRPLVAGARIVIFNGDTCEQSSRDWRAAAEEKLGELRALCQQEGAEPYFVAGNHDPGISESGWLDLAAGRIFLTHGHMMCPGSAPWSHEFLCRKEEILRIVNERENGEADLAYRWETVKTLTRSLQPTEGSRRGKKGQNYVLSAFWPPRRFLAITRSWLGVAKAADTFAGRFRPEASFVFFGHFHRPGVWNRGGRVICNTGAFMRGSRPLLGEFSDGWLSIRTITRRHDEFRIGERRGLFAV